MDALYLEARLLRNAFAMLYESTIQRCPGCRRTFRVLADEVGGHDCPYCGYAPGAGVDGDQGGEA